MTGDKTDLVESKAVENPESVAKTSNEAQSKEEGLSDMLVEREDDGCALETEIATIEECGQ